MQYLVSICDSARDKVDEFRELIDAFFEPRNVAFNVFIPCPLKVRKGAKNGGISEIKILINKSVLYSIFLRTFLYRPNQYNLYAFGYIWPDVLYRNHISNSSRLNSVKVSFYNFLENNFEKISITRKIKKKQLVLFHNSIMYCCKVFSIDPVTRFGGSRTQLVLVRGFRAVRDPTSRRATFSQWMSTRSERLSIAVQYYQNIITLAFFLDLRKISRV